MIIVNNINKNNNIISDHQLSLLKHTAIRHNFDLINIVTNRKDNYDNNCDNDYNNNYNNNQPKIWLINLIDRQTNPMTRLFLQIYLTKQNNKFNSVFKYKIVALDNIQSTQTSLRNNDQKLIETFEILDLKNTLIQDVIQDNLLDLAKDAKVILYEYIN